MQTAEAVEDAELQMLLSSPALRQPPLGPRLAPATLAGQDTLNAISGFQGFQEPVPAQSAPRLAAPVEPQAVSPARRRAAEVGETAATSMTDDADMSADMTDAAESSAGAGSGEAATAAAARARGKWGAPRQPFIAAGRHTSSQETAAQLMSSGLAPTAVASDGNRVATAVGREARLTIAAGLVEHEAATAESAVATPAAASQLLQLPHSSTNPEEPTSVTDKIPAATSPQQQSADTEQVPQLQAEQQHAQKVQHEKAQHAQQQHSQLAQQENAQQAQQQHSQHAQQEKAQQQHSQHAQQVNAQQAQQQQDQQEQAQQQQDKQQRTQQAQQAQQAVDTAEGSTQLVDKAAAGSYRRVAWAPVQNPFPAAGATSAEAPSALTTSAMTTSAMTTSAEMMALGTTAAGATTVPASVSSPWNDAVQLGDLPKDRHASGCTQAEHSPEAAQDSAQQLESGLSQELESGHSLAHEGIQDAAGTQSNEKCCSICSTALVQQGA